MAELIVGSFSFDMTTWNLADIAGGTVTTSSASEVDVTGASGKLAYTITGSGFTTFDTNGFPTDGTVTGFTEAMPGKLPLTITGISISAADFMGFVNTNDPTGLETAIFSGNDVFGGKAGNDVLYGYDGADSFNLIKGGNDTANGGAGNDEFKMGGAFTAADQIDGGTGTDRLFLNGDYSAGVTFGATTLVNVEQIILSRGHSYDLILNDATIGAGDKLTINASALRPTDNFTIDGSADTDGTLRASGGAYTNIFIGGSGNVQFFGAGVSNFFTLTAFNTNDRIEGVGASDQLTFNGDFSTNTVLTTAEISSIHTIAFAAGHDYDFTIASKFATVNFNATALGAGDSLTLDDSAATTPVSFNVGSGTYTLKGGTGADNFTTHGDAIVDIDGGDTSNVNSDEIELHSWNDADHINGGSGVAAQMLIAVTPAPITFATGSIENVGNIQFFTALDATLADGNIAPGATLGLFFEAGANLSFDASAVTAGNLDFDVGFQAGFLAPVVDFAGGAGDDKFDFINSSGSWFSASDEISGGAGNDELDISAGSFAFTATTMTGVETLDITPGNNHTTSVSLDDANVAAGQTLTVNIVGDVTFNGSRETDGAFSIHIEGGHITASGGAGDDTIAGSYTGRANGGAGDDTLSDLNAANVIMDGGAGADQISGGRTFIYTTVSDSTSATYDTLSNVLFSRAVFDVPQPVTAIDTAVTTGALSTASFDTDLAADIGASQLGAGHAVLFTPDSGTLAGDHFLIVDANGVAGYQAGQDLVLQLIGSSFTITTANFSG